MNIIKKVSIPFAGTMLAVLALGNLVQSYSELARNICGILGGIFFILLVLNFILYPSKLKEDLKNSIQASVLGTFSMGFMLLSTYLKPFIGSISIYVWYLAIILHLFLMTYFTIEFIFKFDIKKVFASWYIIYVGIAVVGVSAKAFDKLFLGVISFWFGFVALIILLIVVTYRYIKYDISDPAKALISIYAAPTSLCIAAYISSIENKSFVFVVAMLIIATLIFLFALYKAITFISGGFKPSFSAFTFPFVISAIALKQSIVFFGKLGYINPVLNILLLLEIIVAIVFVIYVYISFVKLLFTNK